MGYTDKYLGYAVRCKLYQSRCDHSYQDEGGCGALCQTVTYILRESLEPWTMLEVREELEDQRGWIKLFTCLLFWA